MTKLVILLVLVATMVACVLADPVVVEESPSAVEKSGTVEVSAGDETIRDTRSADPDPRRYHNYHDYHHGYERGGGRYYYHRNKYGGRRGYH